MNQTNDTRPSCGDFNPTLYAFILRCTNVVNIPLSLIAIYFIIYKSNRAMSTYRWFLLFHAVVLLLVNIQLTILIIPYIIFPIWGGMSLGLYSVLQLGEHIQFGLLMSSASVGIVSTIWLFYYRSQAVLPDGHWLKHSRLCRKIVMAGLMLAFVAAANHLGLLLVEERSEDLMKEQFDQLLPCRNDMLFDMRIHVIDPRAAKYCAVFFGVYFAVGSFFILLFSIPLARYLRSTAILLSFATRKLQMSFLIALSIQVSVVFILVLVPNVILMSFRSVSMNRQFVNDACAVVQSFNVAGDVIAVLLLNTPYRDALFCRKRKLKELSSKVLTTRISIL